MAVGEGQLLHRAACCDCSAIWMRVYGYTSWSCSVLLEQPFWFHWSALERSGLLWEAVTPLWLGLWMGSSFPLLPLPWGEPVPCTKPEWFPGSHSSLLCSNSLWVNLFGKLTIVSDILGAEFPEGKTNTNLIWRVNLYVSVLKINFFIVLESGWIVLEAQRSRNRKHAAWVQHLRYYPVQRLTWGLQPSTLG